ncbi:MAG: hypothetical protein IPH86_09920 [bacterium]|nr:hypothetical protein [bacterium]
MESNLLVIKGGFAFRVASAADPDLDRQRVTARLPDDGFADSARQERRVARQVEHGLPRQPRDPVLVDGNEPADVRVDRGEDFLDHGA